MLHNIEKMRINCRSERLYQHCFLNNSEKINKNITEIQEKANTLQNDITKIRKIFMINCCKNVVKNYQINVDTFKKYKSTFQRILN